MNSFDYSILNNINDNCYKLFENCENGCSYYPLKFSTTLEIKSLIVLNQIIEIIIRAKNDLEIRNILFIEILEHIIEIKCTEFCTTQDLYNINIFISEFYQYLNTMIKLVHEKHSIMQIN